jgi:hypothetical protein
MSGMAQAYLQSFAQQVWRASAGSALVRPPAAGVGERACDDGPALLDPALRLGEETGAIGSELARDELAFWRMRKLGRRSAPTDG